MSDNINFLGNSNLKRAGVGIEWNADTIREFLKCRDDPIYFIKTYVKIIHPDHGLINFELWPFQEEMVKSAIDNRFVICKMPRQVGKTTTVAALLLWYVLFKSNFKIAILANKEKQAREILSRIQLAFEHVPIWLQQGVVEWAKSHMKLENNSVITASSTSSDAIRGTTQNLVYLDEFAFVPTNIQEEFMTSVYPAITAGQKTKILITSTPKGMNLFYKLWTDSEEGRNKYKRVSVHWSNIPGRDAAWREETISNTSERQFQQEFECEFLGSSNTLIDSKKLQQLTYKNPLISHNGVDIYEQPMKDRRYVLVADTSRGVDIDYSAFIVFDITEIPYRIACKFRRSDIPALMYPNVIYELGNHYNNALVLIETNDIGQQVVDILHHDLEYDGVLTTQIKGRAGQKVTGGFGNRKPQMGVKTTKQVKRIGCANFKTLVENNKLIINDFDLLFEMTRFVENNASYEAEEGFHDDLVMCCVLFSWLVNQNYFKDVSDTDIRNTLIEDTEDDVLPFGLYDNGSAADDIAQIVDPYFDEDAGIFKSFY